MLSLLKAVPVWAYALVLVLAGWAFTAYQLQGAKADAAQAELEVANFKLALESQRRTAEGLLASEKAKVGVAEQALKDALDAQQTKDKENGKTVDDLTERLRLAGRLRDPNATTPVCRGGSGSAKVDAIATTDSGAANPAEASGVLSAQFDGLLKRLTREADEINLAYASCRADNLTLREAIAKFNGSSP